MKNIVTIQNKTDLFAQAEKKQKAREVFGKFLYEGELSILFGDSNTGKSILANDIAFFVSGGGHEWEDMESPHIPTLYIDMEMSDKQFVTRYATAVNYIPETYQRATVNMINTDEDDILPAIKTNIIAMQAQENPPKFIIIDNITNGFGSVLNATKMRSLVCDFKALKECYNLTILLIAHCPKRKPGKPITQDDLGGSKMLINFIDSAFAIAPSQAGEKYKYIKQIKSRESVKMDDVMTVEINNEPYLHFDIIGFHEEECHLVKGAEVRGIMVSEVYDEMIARMLLKDMRVRDIATSLGLTVDEVCYRISKF